MKDFCRIFNINFSESLTSCTYFGMQWWGDKVSGRWIGKKIGKHEYYTDHYRRFVVPKELKKKLSNKFKIIFFKLSKNFAKYKNENPKVLRIICKKNDR